MRLETIAARPLDPETAKALQALIEAQQSNSFLENWLQNASREAVEKLLCLLVMTGDWRDPVALATRVKAIQQGWARPVPPAQIRPFPDLRVLMQRYSGDAERAFLSVFPVNANPEVALDPGRLYLELRQGENPEHRKKEADLLKAQADQILGNLEKWSLELLRNLQLRVPRMADSELRFRGQRMAALQGAWDYPRALQALKSTLSVLRQQKSLEGLRSIRFLLIRAEKEWVAYSKRLRDTQPHPLNIWCARIREMQTLAETIRRGLSV